MAGRDLHSLFEPQIAWRCASRSCDLHPGIEDNVDGIAAVSLPGQVDGIAAARELQGTGRFGKHGPIEIGSIGDGHYAVTNGQVWKHIARFGFVDGLDPAGYDIDEDWMLDSGVQDGQIGVDRRKRAARNAMGGQPVSHNRLSGFAAEAEGHERLGRIVQGREIRGRDFFRSPDRGACRRRERWCLESKVRPGAA